MERCWNAGKPGKRPRVSGCGFWEPPVQHGGHVCCCVEFATGGRCEQVEEWVLTRVGRQGEQVCSERRPRRLAGEVGHDLVGPGVERLNDLGANQLIGRHMKAVGVALNGLEQPGSRVGEFSQQRGG